MCVLYMGGGPKSEGQAHLRPEEAGNADNSGKAEREEQGPGRGDICMMISGSSWNCCVSFFYNVSSFLFGGIILVFGLFFGCFVRFSCFFFFVLKYSF